MARRLRHWEPGLAYHVLNRAVRRAALFENDDDYARFESILLQALQRIPQRLLAFSLMRTHFHLVVWPELGESLPDFMQWLTLKHALDWHRRHDTLGTGPVYQGRYKAIPITTDQHLLTACRYVERNALAAGLVDRAEAWPWSSVFRREHHCSGGLLHPWPVPIPLDWVDQLNEE